MADTPETLTPEEWERLLLILEADAGKHGFAAAVGARHHYPHPRRLARAALAERERAEGLTLLCRAHGQALDTWEKRCLAAEAEASALRAEVERLTAVLTSIAETGTRQYTEQVGDPYDMVHGWDDHETVSEEAEIARSALTPSETEEPPPPKEP